MQNFKMGIINAVIVTVSIQVCILHIQPAHGQNDLSVLDQDGSELLHSWLMKEADKLFEKRQHLVEHSLLTEKNLLERQKQLRSDYRRILGYLPERTPLNPQVTGTIDHDDYRIEKVIYESRPNFHVTANLYIPKGSGPWPGILIPCGHSAIGKAAEAYQGISILLAKNGFVVLIVDPICQGERHQVLTKDSKPNPGGGTVGHTLLDAGAKLVGSSTTAYELWDNVRGIDYLQSRPEVIKDKIGVTGNSGGGTQTAYLMAFDDRAAVAAPSCYLMTRKKLFETIGPQDGCQNLASELAIGMDHADCIMMRAPKPTIMLAAQQDFFDFEGVKTAYAEAQQVYSVLGADNKVNMFSYDDTHGFSQPRRQAAVQWMRKWFYNDDAEIIETLPVLHTEEELWATKTGQVRTHFKDEQSVADLNLKRAKELAVKRKAFLNSSNQQVQDKIKDLIGFNNLNLKVDIENKGMIFQNGYLIEKKLIKPKDGIPLPVLIFVPEKRSKAVLYVNSVGKTADMPKIEKLVMEGKMVLSVDLRGWGETRDDPAKNRYAGGMNAEFRNTVLSMHIGRPIFGQRVEDMLFAIIILRELSSSDQVEVIAVNEAGPVAMHTAVFVNYIKKLTIEDSITSWFELLENPRSQNQYTHTIPFALEYYDLPDLEKIRK